MAPHIHTGTTASGGRYPCSCFKALENQAQRGKDGQGSGLVLWLTNPVSFSPHVAGWFGYVHFAPSYSLRCSLLCV